MVEVFIAPDGSSAGTINQAIRPKPDAILVNYDRLGSGPHPRCDSIEAWNLNRDHYMKLVDPYWPVDDGNSPSELCRREDLLDWADSIVLWKSMCLQEEILAAWLVWAMDTLEADLDKLKFVEFSTHPISRKPMRGLGQLNVEAMQSGPQARPLSKSRLDELKNVWNALTSPNPDFLNYLVTENPTISPGTRSCLEALIRRYPDIESGLGIWDFRLLKNVRKHGPNALRAIGFTMVEGDEPDIVYDDYLAERVRRLATGRNPLLSLKGDSWALRDLDVKLTAQGEAVLEGRANNIELNGIDDWVCGVHLQSRSQAVWMCHAGRLVSSKPN